MTGSDEGPPLPDDPTFASGEDLPSTRRLTALICPHCLAGNEPEAVVCSECGKSVVFVLNPAERIPTRIGIGTVMLWIALIGIGLAMARDLPGVAVLYVLVLTPTLIRTGRIIYRRREDWGIESGVGDKLIIFFGSLAVVFAIIVSFSVAFSIVCFPIGVAGFGSNSGVMVILGLGLGTMTGGFAAYHCAKAFWKSHP